MPKTNKSQQLRSKIRNSSRIKRAERVGPKMSPSHALELYYRQQLMSIVMRLRNATNIPELRTQFQDGAMDASPRTAMNEMVRRVEKEVVFINKQSREMASLVARRADMIHKGQFRKAMESQFGIDLSKVITGNPKVKASLRDMTKANARLITKISTDYSDQIQGIVERSFTQGTGGESLVNQIASIIDDVTKEQEKVIKRARLIARDQSAKFNLSLTQARHQDLGIEEYKWVTASDERVRPEHRANHGKTFRWDDPPPETGHPGHDINCRCVARPIINL